MVQLDKTSKALRDLGVEVDYTDQAPNDFSRWDLVHGHALGPAEVRLCRAAGLPVLLSTVYNPFERSMHLGTLREASRRTRIALSLAVGAMKRSHIERAEKMLTLANRRRLAFESADLLLPNAEGEAQAIRAELGVTTPSHIVPNAVDSSAFQSPYAGQRLGAVYVGRIDPHKNQLGLIRAMRGSPVSLTIVGPPHPHHPDYFKKCVQAAAGDVELLPGMPHDELRSIYENKRVHVLPSFFETTGLVSLEAALAGCNVVSTNRGHAREYLEDLAWYCDPTSSSSIRSSVEAAHAAPHLDSLRDRILQRYTWQHAAAATLIGYERVLNTRRSRC